MKCFYKDDGIWIEPETNFEENILSDMFRKGKHRNVVVKNGTSLSQVVAVKVYTVDNGEEK